MSARARHRSGGTVRQAAAFRPSQRCKLTICCRLRPGDEAERVVCGAWARGSEHCWSGGAQRSTACGDPAATCSHLCASSSSLSAAGPYIAQHQANVVDLETCRGGFKSSRCSLGHSGGHVADAARFSGSLPEPQRIALKQEARWHQSLGNPNGSATVSQVVQDRSCVRRAQTTLDVELPPIQKHLDMRSIKVLEWLHIWPRNACFAGLGTVSMNISMAPNDTIVAYANMHRREIQATIRSTRLCLRSCTKQI